MAKVFKLTFGSQGSMSEFPMLQGVDEERLRAVGGKAAILEEIINRWPKHNVPAFTVWTDCQPGANWHSSGDKVYRASSELDVLGGFGLYTTVQGVSSILDIFIEKVTKSVLHPDFLQREKIQMFGESVGRGYVEPTLMTQTQGTPNYWGVVVQHPNDPELLLINYANSPSFEALNVMGYRLALGRDTHTAIITTQGDRRFLSEGANPNVVESFAINFNELEALGIIAPDWVSIAEMGYCSEGGLVETYQLTPLRKAVQPTTGISENHLIFGSGDVSLPLIRLPSGLQISQFLEGELNEIPENPSLAEYLGELREEHAEMFFPGRALFGPSIISWLYLINVVEKEHPDGYIIAGPQDNHFCFDITLRNAKAALVECARNPLESLNHNVSRLLHKVPLVIVGKHDLKGIQSGEMATLTSDGASYNIR